MQIKPYPGLSKRFNWLCLSHFPLLLLVMLLAAMGDKFIPGYRDWHLFEVFFASIWLLALHLFARGFLMLKRSDCPTCHGRTQPFSKHPALPDNHSAYCAACHTLWDTGVGNSAD